ncbi:hypothetical protein GSI_06640 [Ganoderma sinense ZZ0214-1]|uniref:Uncharacterized protein n=1 Tax=Ganoderma sinense ZZ0214-1 TaxID=1077348 RepID=A0A2G8SDT5_9APHY|nr:hypothetical protein GSI_06640 [Ganoderma sinense ZZ0214-1]
MSGNGEHDAGRLRPPMHPTQSSTSHSIPLSPASSPPPPPTHASQPSAHPDTSLPEGSIAQPPSLLPRPSASSPSVSPSSGFSPPAQFVPLEQDQGLDGEVEATTSAVHQTGLGVGPSSEALSSAGSKDEEELSEVQLRELYDDEEIDRFLKVFSTYVREVRTTQPIQVGTTHAGEPASFRVATIAGEDVSPPTSVGEAPAVETSWDRPLSERIAVELVVPLLPPPRSPPPDFSLGRLKQTASRLFVALEPIYSQIAVPLLKLATWRDTRTSFGYCALYWILWYHGLLFSAFGLGLLCELLRRKLHPYPSLAELRAHRRTIDRSQAFGSLLAARLSAAPALGLHDVWGILGDYRRLRKVKKPKEDSGKNGSAGAGEEPMKGDDTSSVSLSTGDTADQQAEEDADLKRLGLFLLNEVADFLERLKNIFLWRQPTASAICGAVMLAWFILGLLPARYLARLVGLVVGGTFWHVIPVVAAIPESERRRIPSPLSFVPSDTEYAMELVSQRVARGLPVTAKQKKPGMQSLDSNVPEGEDGQGSSSSVDWKKVGERIASTKEMASDVKGLFREGQWKKAENWKALNPLAPKAVSSQNGDEPHIETRTFPATMKSHGPGLISLTPTSLFFTSLLSPQPVLTVELADITGVKKVTMTKGLEVRYSHQHEHGAMEEKDVSFQLVGARGELFARLVSSGGKKWAKM